MINLTELFSARPAPIKGARLVKGYAASGCKESSELAIPVEMQEKIAKAKLAEKERTRREAAERKQKQLSQRKVEIADMFKRVMLGRGWLSTEEISNCTGISRSNVLITLNGLLSAGLVVRQTIRTIRAAKKYEWMWK